MPDSDFTQISNKDGILVCAAAGGSRLNDKVPVVKIVVKFDEGTQRHSVIQSIFECEKVREWDANIEKQEEIEGHNELAPWF